MKKLLCALLAALLIGGCALAEGSAFRAGTGGAYLNANLFFVVDEGETRALVRVDPEGKAMIADRAEGVSSTVTLDGSLYYLREEGGAWALIRRGEGGEKGVAYAFAPGEEARALGVYGEDLFCLVNDQLHVVYPEQSLCLRLADAKMSEYAIANDYAYFVSLTDVVRYELPAPDGATASAESGCLYKLNLSTGNTALLLKAGAENLKCFSGKLYFHNLSEGYLSTAGGKSRVEGRLYAFDLAAETPSRVLGDYDWDYFPTEEGLILYRAGEVAFVDSDETIATPGLSAIVVVADGHVLINDAGTFTAYPLAAIQ